MPTLKLTSADVEDILEMSDEGVRKLVQRGVLHPTSVGARRPIRVFDEAEVQSVAGARTAGAWAKLVERERAAGRKASTNPARYGETVRQLRARLGSR